MTSLTFILHERTIVVLNMNFSHLQKNLRLPRMQN